MDSAIIECEDVLHIAEAVAEPELPPVGMMLDEGLKLLAVLVCGPWQAVFHWRTLDVCQVGCDDCSKHSPVGYSLTHLADANVDLPEMRHADILATVNIGIPQAVQFDDDGNE